MPRDYDRSNVPDVDWIIGIDLARGGADSTAIMLVERTEPVYGGLADYTVRYMEKFADKTAPKRVPVIVDRLWNRCVDLHAQRVIRRDGRLGPSAIDPPVRIAVDVTDTGPFGLEPLVQAGFTPIAISIHGGDNVGHPDPNTYRVPKRDLAGVLQVVVRDRRLTWDRNDPLAAEFAKELANFRVKLNPRTGHDSYGAGSLEGWQETLHDDMVIAASLAVWLGEEETVPGLDPYVALAFKQGGMPSRRL